MTDNKWVCDKRINDEPTNMYKGRDVYIKRLTQGRTYTRRDVHREGCT